MENKLKNDSNNIIYLEILENKINIIENEIKKLEKSKKIIDDKVKSFNIENEISIKGNLLEKINLKKSSKIINEVNNLKEIIDIKKNNIDKFKRNIKILDKKKENLKKKESRN